MDAPDFDPISANHLSQNKRCGFALSSEVLTEEHPCVVLPLPRIGSRRERVDS